MAGRLGAVVLRLVAFVGWALVAAVVLAVFVPHAAVLMLLNLAAGRPIGQDLWLDAEAFAQR